MSEVENTKQTVKSSISPEERLEQRRKALEKANAVRSEKASLKKREKEIQKQVYQQYKEELDRTEKAVFAPKSVPKPEAPNEVSAEAPSGYLGGMPPPELTPVKHIKIEKKRNKRVILEWSDSDSDIDDEAIQRAFKNGYKKKPNEVSVGNKQISKEDYERTLLQSRYGQTVKKIMDDQIDKQKQVIQYYHGY